MQTSLYTTDFVAWAESQATALREKRFGDLDLAELIEEVDDLSRRDRHALRSHLTKLCLHLLKIEYQPERDCGSWRGSVVAHAAEVNELIEASPSLGREVLDNVPKAYANARKQAAAETGLPLATFPVAPTPDFESALRAALAG